MASSTMFSMYLLFALMFTSCLAVQRDRNVIDPFVTYLAQPPLLDSKMVFRIFNIDYFLLCTCLFISLLRYTLLSSIVKIYFGTYFFYTRTTGHFSRRGLVHGVRASQGIFLYDLYWLFYFFSLCFVSLLTVLFVRFFFWYLFDRFTTWHPLVWLMDRKRMCT